MESFQGFLRLRQWLDYFIVFFFPLFTCGLCVCVLVCLQVWCLDPSFLICSQKSIDDCSRGIVWKV
uniref:Uncharacterized protein n=1 Tax=Manihot esculenta TaxID=3983 RepID=A0A2C9VMP5_MANES